MKERFKLIPEVCLILIRERKVLLGRRTNTGWQDGNYGLPAGHGEEGETMREGVCREAFEELGIVTKPEDLVFVHAQHRYCDDPGNPHARIGFYFTTSHFDGEPHIAEPEKCDDLSWSLLTELPLNTVEHVRAAIESYIRGELYSEFGWVKD
jgi:ADP-ribose pyrophosphatase YjhB (NUDIX family)